MTKSVPEAEFKAQFVELLDEVVDRGDEVLVTRDGKPVAKLTRIDAPFRARSLEELRGSGKIVGDIVAPLEEESPVTKDSEAVAKALSMRGPMYGTIKFLGDIVAPIDEE